MFTVHVELQMNVNSLANGSLRRKQKNLQESEGVLRMGAARNPGARRSASRVLHKPRPAPPEEARFAFLVFLSDVIHGGMKYSRNLSLCHHQYKACKMNKNEKQNS